MTYTGIKYCHRESSKHRVASDTRFSNHVATFTDRDYRVSQEPCFVNIKKITCYAIQHGHKKYYLENTLNTLLLSSQSIHDTRL